MYRQIFKTAKFMGLIVCSLSLSACVSPPSTDPSTHSAIPNNSINTSGRFKDNGDGTVTDFNTKLMWKKCIEGYSGRNCETGNFDTREFLWTEASTQAQQSFANHQDWRIPSLEELRSLVRCGDGKPSDPKAGVVGCMGVDRKGKYTSPTIDTQAFPNPRSMYATYFWTSTNDEPSRAGSNMTLSFDDGGVNSSYKNNTSRHQVRLVRNAR
ncbi:MAG: DUF1566 domain-containing protein [Thiothrix sp.]|nr:MAG: DUF1566 domain-containing protein [Thiothrix sp.]